MQCAASPALIKEPQNSTHGDHTICFRVSTVTRDPCWLPGTDPKPHHGEWIFRGCNLWKVCRLTRQAPRISPQLKQRIIFSLKTLLIPEIKQKATSNSWSCYRIRFRNCRLSSRRSFRKSRRKTWRPSSLSQTSTPSLWSCMKFFCWRRAALCLTRLTSHTGSKSVHITNAPFVRLVVVWGNTPNGKTTQKQ